MSEINPRRLEHLHATLARIKARAHGLPVDPEPASPTTPKPTTDTPPPQPYQDREPGDDG